MEFEIQSGYPRLLVAGIDEVGRGCLAGPVVAAAVVLPSGVDLSSSSPHPWLKKIDDSKRLSMEEREELFPLIQSWAKAWAIGSASVEEIDQINIYHASHLAMARAIERLAVQPEHILIDGNAIPKHFDRSSCTAIVKGDQRCLSVAAASILAKVHRDRGMAELDRQYPGYGFSRHKGYFTPMHQESLKKLGPCSLHRRSFAPVAEEYKNRNRGSDLA